MVDKKSYLNFFLLIFEHGNLYLNGLPEKRCLIILICFVLLYEFANTYLLLFVLLIFYPSTETV